MSESKDRRPRKRILRWVGVAIVALLGIPVAALAVIMALGITFSLDRFRADIEAAAKGALGREVRIEGPLTLVPALRLTVEVQGLSVANPPGWDNEDFLRLDLARARLDLLPLLDRQISIDEIAIEGVGIQLEFRANGDINWILEPESPGTGGRHTTAGVRVGPTGRARDAVPDHQLPRRRFE